MLFTRVKSKRPFIFRFLPVAAFLISAIITGCATVPDNWSALDYTVKKGDTLYSIAWRYEQDFQDIARWNNIPPPYAIYPGQRLHMTPDTDEGTHTDEQPEVVAKVPESAPAPEQEVITPQTPAEVSAPPSMPQEDHVIVGKGDTLYSIARDRHLPVSRVARWNALKPPYMLHPGQIVRVKPPMVDVITGTGDRPRVVKPSVTGSKTQTPVRTVVSLPKTIRQWQWPAKGKIIRGFHPNDTARKGIAIRGHLGEQIHAAAAGKVVYSGNGLLSYGNLVIIKHNNTYLSAYAHNQKLLVDEGQVVSQGQVIAQMGKGDRGRPELHFEIRRNGKPIDPLGLLPR